MTTRENTTEIKKVVRQKRYKNTTELWGELLSWVTVFASISLMLFASFGATFLNVDRGQAMIFNYITTSIMLVFGLIYAWSNRRAHMINSVFWFKILRVMGITSILLSFGFGVFLITTHAFASSTVVYDNVSWLVINLIILSSIVVISYIVISSTEKTNSEESRKVFTEKLTLEETEEFTKEIFNEDKKTSQSDAIQEAIEAYKRNKTSK